MDGFSHALVPGGVLVMELPNRDRVIRELLDVTVTQTGDDYMIDRHKYDAETGRVITERTYVIGAQRRTLAFFVRMLSTTELRGWLRAAGFATVEFFGEDLQPITRNSRRMLVRATRDL